MKLELLFEIDNGKQKNFYLALDDRYGQQFVGTISKSYLIMPMVALYVLGCRSTRLREHCIHKPNPVNLKLVTCPFWHF